MIARLLEVSAGRSEKQQQNKHTMNDRSSWFFLLSFTLWIKITWWVVYLFAIKLGT
jgi:hypothetical protein